MNHKEAKSTKAGMVYSLLLVLVSWWFGSV